MSIILREMEKTRALMIQSGIKNGLHSLKTIRLSRKLDQLHNQYNKEQGYPQEKTPIYQYYNH